MFVATHPDLADPDSDDPVARQSSRAQCSVPFAGPSDWSLLSSIRHDHPAYRQLIGHEPGTPFAKMKEERMRSVSPLTYVSADDPPMMIVHGDADVIVGQMDRTTRPIHVDPDVVMKGLVALIKPLIKPKVRSNPDR